MELVKFIISFILHIDEHLVEIISLFDHWTYFVLFLIVFIETGVVIFPFLPGDSLLFASGTFASMGSLSLSILILTFISAAILGDAVNYYIGQKVGKSVIEKNRFSRMINREKMIVAERFFNRHGGKTIIIARFMPFIRTFVPFVAGASGMNYRLFTFYNVVGAVLWVLICTLAGYLFGNLRFVEENFSVVILIIIFLSILPAIFSFFKNR